MTGAPIPPSPPQNPLKPPSTPPKPFMNIRGFLAIRPPSANGQGWTLVEVGFGLVCLLIPMMGEGRGREGVDAA